MSTIPAPPTPILKTVIYAKHDIVELPIGATALKYGDLCKGSAGLMVPCVSTDHNLEAFVALENMNASGTADGLTENGDFVPLCEVAQIEMAFNQANQPTLLTAYGISDARTLDPTNTTQLLLTVLSIDLNRQTAMCKPYLKTS